MQNPFRIDRAFGSVLEEIKSAQIVVSEVEAFLQDYNARIEFNPERLEAIRDRLGELDRLKRKYGGTLEAVLDYRREIDEQYDLAADFEGAIERLDGETGRPKEALSKAAERLSAKRHEVAERIEAGHRRRAGQAGDAQQPVRGALRPSRRRRRLSWEVPAFAGMTGRKAGGPRANPNLYFSYRAAPLPSPVVIFALLASPRVTRT